MKSAIFAAAVAAALATSAQAAPTIHSAQASIPFVNYGGIRDWHAADSKTLYIQDSHRNWYRADLFAPCFELPFAQTIGFVTRGIDSFDRFSSIRVRGERCEVSSLVRSDPPPSKAERSS
jgi:hypothetical protein